MEIILHVLAISRGRIALPLPQVTEALESSYYTGQSNLILKKGQLLMKQIELYCQLKHSGLNYYSYLYGICGNIF